MRARITNEVVNAGGGPWASSLTGQRQPQGPGKPAPRPQAYQCQPPEEHCPPGPVGVVRAAQFSGIAPAPTPPHKGHSHGKYGA